MNIVLRGATGDMVVVGRMVVSNGGKSVDDSSSRQRGEGGKSPFDILYIFMYNAIHPYSDDIMRLRIFIGDWNGYSSDDILLFDCC